MCIRNSCTLDLERWCRGSCRWYNVHHQGSSFRVSCDRPLDRHLGLGRSSSCNSGRARSRCKKDLEAFREKNLNDVSIIPWYQSNRRPADLLGEANWRNRTGVPRYRQRLISADIKRACSDSSAGRTKRPLPWRPLPRLHMTIFTLTMRRHRSPPRPSEQECPRQ